MPNETEEVFAEVAHEEAILNQIEAQNQHESSSSSKSRTRTEVAEAEESSSETSALLKSGDNTSKRQTYHRAGASYDRAINEPWTGAYGSGDLPWYRKPSIFWLLPAFFPFCVAFGGVLVPKTYLVNDLICRDYFSDRAAQDPNFQYLPVLIGGDNHQCTIPEIQRLVTWFNLLQDVIPGVLSAIVAPYFGSLSDRVGRKRVIVLTSVGTLSSEIITILVGRYPDQVSVWWMQLGAFADGLCGSFTVAIALSSAFATDCTAPDKRAVAFGYFQGTFFSGVAIGPIISGLLIQAFDNLLVPFYLAIACHIFFISFTALLIPETLSKERQVVAREKYAKEQLELSGDSWLQTIKRYNIFKPLWVLWPTGEGSSPALRRNLLVLATIDFMMFGVAMGTIRILLIYARGRFDWSAVDSSFFMSACNVVRVTGLIGLLPLLTWLFRGQSRTQLRGHRGSSKLDLTIVKVAILFDLVGYLGYAFAPTGAFMYAAGMFAAIGGIGVPILSSAMTKHIPPHMTGAILGATALYHALARVAAPVVFYSIYAATVGWYSSFVYLCLASVFVLVFIMSWFLKTNVYLRDESAVNQETSGDSTVNETR